MTQGANPYDLQIGGGLSLPPQAGGPPAPPPVAAPPPAPVPINNGGAQIGGGLTLPTQSFTPQPSDLGPAALKATMAAHVFPSSVSKLAAENANTQKGVEDVVAHSRREDRLRELARYGGSPGVAETAGKAAALSSAPPGGVKNPFAAGVGGSPVAGVGGLGSRDYYQLGKAPTGRIGKDYDEATEKLQKDRRDETYAQDDLVRLQQQQQQEHADSKIQAEQHYAAGAEAAQKHLSEWQKDNDERLNKIKDAQDDLAKDKIDPDRIYGKPGTAGNILSHLGTIIASAGGAFGASLNHTENFAQKGIDAIISRDIDAQKEAHANKAEGVRNQLNMYDRHRQEGLTAQEAEAATRSDLYTHALRQGDALSEKSGSKIFQQNWLAQRAGLQKQADEEAQKTAQEINKAGYARLMAAQVGNGQQTKIANDVAKVDLDNAETANAVKRIKDAPEGELAGYGLGGRLRHSLSGLTGLDLESDEAKANRRAVDKLNSRDLKDDGSRVNTVELARKEKLVRNEEDVRALAAERIQKALLARKQAQAGIGGKGSGSARRSLDDPYGDEEP